MGSGDQGGQHPGRVSVPKPQTTDRSAAEPDHALLERLGISCRRHSHTPAVTTADYEALGFDTTCMVKTLAFGVAGTRSVVLVALRVRDAVHYAEVARHVGVKRDRLALLDEASLRERLGASPGAVGPFCTAEGIALLVDHATLGLDRAYCGSGVNSMTLEVTGAALALIPGVLVGAFARPRDVEIRDV